MRNLKLKLPLPNSTICIPFWGSAITCNTAKKLYLYFPSTFCSHESENESVRTCLAVWEFQECDLKDKFVQVVVYQDNAKVNKDNP